MFDESFIESLPDNPGIAGRKIVDTFLSFIKEKVTSKEDITKHYEAFLKALALLEAFAESHGINIDHPVLTSDMDKNFTLISETFRATRTVFDRHYTSIVRREYKKAFELKFGRGLPYEFSEGDLKRIQKLIKELRELILNTKELDENYRSRLLSRMDNLQSQLTKRVSDLDRLWGLVIEVSVIVKKVRENSKPIVESIAEIADIVWRTQARAEELPSNAPLELPELKSKG
jgi:hypothetical protein